MVTVHRWQPSVSKWISAQRCCANYALSEHLLECGTYLAKLSFCLTCFPCAKVGKSIFCFMGNSCLDGAIAVFWLGQWTDLKHGYHPDYLGETVAGFARRLFSQRSYIHPLEPEDWKCSWGWRMGSAEYLCILPSSAKIKVVGNPEDSV